MRAFEREPVHCVLFLKEILMEGKKTSSDIYIILDLTHME